MPSLRAAISPFMRSALASASLLIQMCIRDREKATIPSEYSDLHLHSKGFLPEIEVQDFPIRGKAVYLRIKRRR